jgi:2-polyprenyl-3-methyl-5-hydroxy-6-metoxy-1,4-benzoquinol methylase
MSRGASKAALHDEVWESLGSQDPDWAVLTAPELRHGGWSHRLDDFYSSGRTEVRRIFETLPPDAGYDRALDWGSGTGRLTFALLDQCAHVTAVDVSRSMLATLTGRAREHGLAPRVTPTLVADVRPAADHDLAVCLLVLQHLRSRADMTDALRTLVACLRVGGYLVVEIPEWPLTMRAQVQPRFRAYQVLRAFGVEPARLHDHGLSGISMRCLTHKVVADTLLAAGAEIVGEPRRRSDGGHRYARYVARRTR